MCGGERNSFFFISGFPANNHRSPISNFVDDLSKEKLGDAMKAYKDYGFRFIGKGYSKGKVESPTPTPSWDKFKELAKGPVSRELEKGDRIICEERLKSHINVFSATDNGILAPLYFHSEQSLWPYVKEKIREFEEVEGKKVKGDMRSHLAKASESTIASIFLDICSYYDMCWGCGDTLASCCHTKELGKYEVYIRATGCNAYVDRPFSEDKSVVATSLRDMRSDFSCYEEGSGFEFRTAALSSYKPYIAHAMKEDFPK